MKETGGTISGSVHIAAVVLANSVALITPGFGGCVYFPTGKGFTIIGN